MSRTVYGGGDRVYERDKERLAYNAAHGTNYSYGQYYSLKRQGVILCDNNKNSTRRKL